MVPCRCRDALRVGCDGGGFVDDMGVPPVRPRPYRDADLALTAALESDPAVMRHLGGTGGPEREDRIRRVHDRRLAGAGRGDWYRAIIVDDDAAPVGLVAIWGDTWQDQHIW